MLDVPAEFRDAYEENQRLVTLRKNQLGCWLGILMTPTFSLLDHFVYPKYQFQFFLLRLLVSVLMTVLFFVIGTRLGGEIPLFAGKRHFVRAIGKYRLDGL